MNNPEQLKLASILKMLMQKKGLSYNKLSQLCGISASTLKSYSNNISPRSMLDLKKLAKTLDVSIHFLLFGEEEKSTLLTSSVVMPTNPSFSTWAKVTIEFTPPKEESNI